MLHQAQPDKPSATQFRPLWNKLVQRCLQCSFKVPCGTCTRRKVRKVLKKLVSFLLAAVALPFIDAVDSNAATLLYNRAFNLDFSGDAAALKTLIEATYPKLGVGSGIGLITCADVGTLHDSNNNVLWEGCKDPSPSSSKNNDTTLGLGIGIPLGAIAITALVFVVFLWRKSS